MISGLFAAVAGLALTARVRSGQPLSGELLELYAIAAAVLGGTSLYGGRGAVWRTAVGVALITVIQNGLNLLNASSELQMIAVGIVFIIAALSETVANKRFRIGTSKRVTRVSTNPDPGTDSGPSTDAGTTSAPSDQAPHELQHKS